MPAHESLSNYQFRYRPAKMKAFQHEVAAVDKETGKNVGYLLWKNTGPVDEVYVREPQRRIGVATEMWNHANRVADAAKGNIPYPEHSNERTDQGDAWAKSTGAYVPKNNYIPEGRR
jgi:hypothetical protein